MFDAFLTTDGLIALVTLTFLEIVLGVDNVIFISILSGKLRAEQQLRARRVGLMAAMLMRILLLLSHRAGYRHPFGDRSYHQRVSLRPLAHDEMHAMTGSILGTGDLPAVVSSLIARKAEGNPFFVEELTKWLVEDGVLRRENGRIVLARELPTIAAPITIRKGFTSPPTPA